MEGARSSVASCELGTGIKFKKDENEIVIKDITFREMAGPEEDLLASKKMNPAQKIENIMVNCIQKFGDVEDRSKIKEMFNRVVTVDRWYYLIQLRIHSVGSIYSFESICPECDEKDKLDFDLNQIKIKESPDVDKLINETKLPSGKTVRWRVADATIENQIERKTKDNNARTVALFERIMELDGKPPGFEAIRILGFKDRGFLRKEIDRIEGEIDDDYKATCPKCGHEYKEELPINGADFFYP